MPRAIGAFRQAGFAVEAYPVDYQTNGWHDMLRRVRQPFRRARASTDNALHEWIGLIAYRVTGKIVGAASGTFAGPPTSAVRARCAAEANWRRHITMTTAVGRHE